METIFDKHERIALQVSGGKDSLACLFLMEPYWGQMTVYWLNTGDAYPETVQVMQYVRQMVPHFVEIDGQQPKVIQMYGYPSDLVPAANTNFGVASSGEDVPLIQDRYACCMRVRMEPMFNRMVEDGVTMVIRGQKAADQLKAPLKSGTVEDGVTYIFPIEDWNDQQVMDYLQRLEVPIPRFYEMLESAPECRTCSAYWDDGVAKYLKQYHPEHHVEVQRRLGIIGSAVEKHMMNFYNEVE